MRIIMLLPLFAISACSGESQPAEQKKEPAAEHITAGQWEMTSEVTKVTKRDNAAPALKMPEGSKTAAQSCVAEADVKRPPAALFAPQGLECDYRDIYIRGGRFNATLACTAAGQGGDVAVVVNGSYAAETIDGISIAETRFAGEGDAKIEAKLSGRRTGACSAPAAKS